MFLLLRLMMSCFVGHELFDIALFHVFVVSSNDDLTLFDLSVLISLYEMFLLLPLM